jgi:quercetin dioxygenase-like cupin family protein
MRGGRPVTKDRAKHFQARPAGQTEPDLPTRTGVFIAEVVLGPGTPGTPAHTHDSDELLYVTEGRLAVQVGQERDAPAGKRAGNQ